MKIVADENIPLVRKIFSNLGAVTMMPGRAMGREQIADADILLVRSVTQINKQLLEKTRVRYIGSATSGIDHVDQSYLSKHNIAFWNAAGCNANSVVEYVLSALSALEENQGVHWKNKKIGIVGLGNVGSALLERMQRLGVDCLGFDPFLSDPPEGIEWCPSFKQLCLQSDIITLHTPLTKKSSHPTWHMLNIDTLQWLKPSAVLINTARGAVVDNTALLSAMRNHMELLLVFDVWEYEPEINFSLMHHTTIATPHIAGYSLDGKIAATRRLYRYLSEHLGISPHKGLRNKAPEPDVSAVKLRNNISVKDAIAAIMPTVYDVRIDDMRMRQLMYSAKPEERHLIFDRLRRFYPERREFKSLTVQLRQEEVAVFNALSSYGFTLQTI